MALVRVYCGVATAEIAPWLTVAVVDDAGRLLDMRHISDDPAGYAYLVALVAERSGGSFPVAMDRHEHLVAQLLAAANRPLAIADDATVHDFAERFADDTNYDEVQAPASQRRAVGLARALQAGALYATAQSPSWDMDELKPVLAAHAAVSAGRQAAAVALREVLRELFPAALRAYLDPAEFIPLKILDTFPEPGLLTSAPSARTRESALVAELTATGVTDPTTAVNAIGALRVAVEESRGWNSNRMIAPAVAETVRQAVAAVRACDAAIAALVGSLVERLSGAPAAEAPITTHPAAPVSPAVSRRPTPGPAAEVPAGRIAPRASAASAAAAGVAAAMSTAASYGDPSFATASTYGGQPSLQGAPSFGDPSFGDTQAHGIPVQRGYAEQVGPPPGYQEAGFPEPGFAPPGNRSSWPTSAPPEDEYASGYGGSGSTYGQTAYTNGNGNGYAPTPSYGGHESNGYASTPPPNGNGYGAGPSTNGYGSGPASGGNGYGSGPPGGGGYGAGPSTNGNGYGAVPAPSGYPAGPPTNGNGYGAGPPPPNGYSGFAPGNPGWESTYGGGAPPMYGPDNLSFSSDPLNAPLDTTGQTPRIRDAGPGSAGQDDDLLIFSDISSAWFNFDGSVPTTEPLNWGSLADDGWRAAEQLASPSVGPETTAGLPRRVPQANLVPGSAQAPAGPVRIVRDPKSIADHTEGYFRGWRRGQEVNGFAVGQRDRAAWEFNREQRARQGAARLS